jgi:hypothetical protein
MYHQRLEYKIRVKIRYRKKFVRFGTPKTHSGTEMKQTYKNLRIFSPMYLLIKELAVYPGNCIEIVCFEQYNYGSLFCARHAVARVLLSKISDEFIITFPQNNIYSIIISIQNKYTGAEYNASN